MEYSGVSLTLLDVLFLLNTLLCSFLGYICKKTLKQIWVPPESPGFLANRQAVSPTSESLPVSQGSLGRRWQAQPPRRRHGSSNVRGSGWKSKGSSIVEAITSEGRPGGGRGAVNTGVADTNNCGGDSDSHPRSQERRISRDDEDGRILRAQGNRVGDSNITVVSTGVRGRTGSGEAWGTAPVTAARNSERMQSGGGSSRGNKSSAGPEVWAWAGAGGGAARGKAMLSAYGLQVEKHNPTCPRGTPGDGAVRHGRWQRGQIGSAKKVEGGAGTNGEDGREKGGGDGGGAGTYRGGSRSRVSDHFSGRVTSGHAHRFRGGKGCKQRVPAPSNKSNSATWCSGERSSSGSRDRATCEEEENGSRKVGQASPAAQGSWGDEVAAAIATSAPSPRLPDTPRSTERVAEDSHRPADHLRRALQDLLVPPRGTVANGEGSTPMPQHGACINYTTVTVASDTFADGPANTAVSGQVAVLMMDGRGGSAAPPYRPRQLGLRAPTTAAYSPILPGLTGTSGAGAEMIAAFEAESSSGYVTRESGSSCGGGGGGGGDDHSTPPVSRQRAYSNHSPWQARKHPRGFPGSKGGTGFGYCHSCHQGCSHAEENVMLGSGSKQGTCLSSESTANATPVANLSSDYMVQTGLAVGVGLETEIVNRSWAAPPITLAKPIDEASISKEGAAAERHAPSGIVEVYPSGQAGLDPFDRLPHGSIAATPQSELIDHFKFAPRPTSRRGARKQGAEGGTVQPGPAFCLFSGHRDDRGGGDIRGVRRRERREEERQSKSRDCGRCCDEQRE